MNPLTSEEKMTLANLLQSKGWEILTQKVFSEQKERLREQCCTNPNDVRYVQGFYAGFLFAGDLAVSAARSEEEIKAMRQPTEMDLIARKGRY